MATVSFHFIYFINAILILKKDVITNETVNYDLKNLKYNLLKNSGKILSEHSNDPDLQFF